jgi:branched-subunit amino acid aminotransferase/4-amino-4-deoxychorismate lyase
MAYIYEYIRTQGFEPMHFEEHYSRLDALACKHLFIPFAVERNELRRVIGETLRSGHSSAQKSNGVYVQYDHDGELKVVCAMTLYDEFSLRALRPKFFVCRISGELLTENTSAKEALLDLNHTTTLSTEQGKALWANERGEVLDIDGAEVIAIFEDEIRFASVNGIETRLAYEAAKEMGREVTNAPILLDDIAQAKELLYIDYRGITAIDSAEGHYFMDLTASKLAAKIAERER